MINCCKVFLFATTIVLASSCRDNTPKKFTGYDSWPFLGQHFEKESILVINVGDFTSKKTPHIETPKSQEIPNLPALIKVGGSTGLKGYLDIIEKRFPTSQLHVVSANNIDYRYFAAKDYIHHPLTAIKVPLEHFLSMQPPKLHEMPWINSNVLNIQTGKVVTSDAIKEDRPHSDSKSDIKFLAINDHTLVKDKKISGFYFQDSVTTVLKSAKAKIKVLLYHGPTECQGKVMSEPTPFTMAKKLTLDCPKKDYLQELVQRLPRNSIDLIIASSLNKGAGFINETPVLFSGDEGHHLYPVLLFPHEKQGLNNKKSYLLPPIKLCHQMLTATHKCDLDSFTDEEKKKLEITGHHLIPAKFLGHEVLLAD